MTVQPAPPPAAVEPNDPAWVRLLASVIPDQRSWGMVFGVAITFYLLHGMMKVPALTQNGGFMAFSGSVFTGTALAVYSNLFGGTKAQTDNNKATNAAMTDMAQKAAQTSPQQQQGLGQ